MLYLLGVHGSVIGPLRKLYDIVDFRGFNASNRPNIDSLGRIITRSLKIETNSMVTYSQTCGTQCDCSQ